MAIDLLNSFLQRGQNVSSNTTSKTTQTTQNLPVNVQVMRAMKALQAGQTIQGEVVSVKGDEVRLAIMKDVMIDAKLAQSMHLTQGIVMPFQVKANTSQGLSLIPLFTNTAADPNALKALDMAQIPVNEKSLELVQTLMEKGMPIDKQTLQEMYREVVAFKDATVRDLVNLHQMEIPVTKESLTQISMYQNNQHYLNDAFVNIGSTIGEQLESLMAEGKTQTARDLLQQIQQLMQAENGGTKPSLENPFAEGRHTIADGTGEITLSAGGETQPKGATIVLTEDMLLKGENVAVETKSAQFTEEKAAETGRQSMNAEAANVKVNGENSPEILKQQENEKEQQQTLQGQKRTEELGWKELEHALFTEKSPKKIGEMFQKIWNKEITNQWMLKPEMVMDKKNVKEYYEKLDSQIKQLEKIFENMGMSKSPAAKVVQNTSANLDFMNQLNQLHAYIQLPLKLANQNARGELYVFTNKRNLSKEDGKVTALLHLDMEYLGKMDVYVALENQKVSTNFCLEKEEYLDFLEAHMDTLTVRLNKRGYSCDMKTMLRNTEEQPMIRIMEKQKEQPMLLSMQAFDVRA